MSSDCKDLGISEQQNSWKRKPRSASSELTHRERQVLAMLVSGRSQHLISKDLGIAQSTVWQHVHSMKSRLGLENLVQVGMWAERTGYRPGELPPPDQCDCGPGCDGQRCSSKGGSR